MAKETVEAVRQAELKAAKLEDEAIVKKNECIQNALEEGKKLVITNTKKALQNSAKLLEKANESNEGLLNDAIIRGEAEIKLLKELVKDREALAIDLILKEVI